jgi:hypothetical protein
MYQKLVKSACLLLLIVVVSANSFKVFSQKCNYEKNEIDALTELIVKRTDPYLFTRINGQPLYAKAQCIGTNKYLKLLFYTFNDFSFQEQREVGFVLSNNEEIMVYPRVMPVDSAKMDEITSTNSLLIYKLNEAQFQKLLNYPVVKFKYFLISGFIEEPIKPAKQGVVMDVLRCVE